MLLFTILYLVTTGIGIWGNNQPVGGHSILSTFVWWIGIGHAGTLISAILLLLNQKWRTSINRFAEAMTLFAVAAPVFFRCCHGRPWLAYWLFPYPNTMGMWPQFRSPLMWDVFAVSTYATISLLFWYVGLIPDFATLRDRAKNKYFKFITPLSLGAGAVRRGTGIVTRSLIYCWREFLHRLCFRFTQSLVSTFRCHSFRDGTPRFFRRTSLRARFLPDSQWF